MPPSSTSHSDHDSLESDSRLLPRVPPAWTLKTAAWLIILLFAAAALGSVLIVLPETFRCPCVLVPEGGADPIQSPRMAIIRQVRIHEGQIVAAGEEMFVLSSEEVRDWDTQQRTLTEELRSRQSSLEKEDAAAVSELGIKEEEVAQAKDEVGFREKYSDTVRDLVGRLEKLVGSGSISLVEMITHRLELAGAEKDLSVAKRTLNAVTLQRQQLATGQSRKHAEAESEIEKLKLRLAALKSQLENTQKNLLSVVAPYDAVVISLAARNTGSVVQNGQELCQLARPDGNLRARLQISEPALPRVAVGQRIRFFAAAFPYQRYGTITGKVDWISPSAVASPEGRLFVALATLDKTSFEVRGEPHPLRVGMQGEARVIVGGRMIIEYALDPIRQLRENARR